MKIDKTKENVAALIVGAIVMSVLGIFSMYISFLSNCENFMYVLLSVRIVANAISILGIPLSIVIIGWLASISLPIVISMLYLVCIFSCAAILPIAVNTVDNFFYFTSIPEASWMHIVLIVTVFLSICLFNTFRGFADRAIALILKRAGRTRDIIQEAGRYPITRENLCFCLGLGYFVQGNEFSAAEYYEKITQVFVIASNAENIESIDKE
jgi:hypothetical protein